MAGDDRLSVWMYGRHIATLTQAKGRLSMAYTPEAQRTYDVNTPLLSISLPLGSRPFPQEKCRPFFEGLLPEGETRRMLAYDFRLQEDDTFGLLRALGRDCAGALVVLPEGEPLPSPEAVSPTPLSDEELVERLRQLGVEPLGIDRQVRVSLAGIQQKLVLTRLPSGGWALPIHGLPSTHILKRADRRFPDMVANEAFCLAIARRMGLRVAAAEVVDHGEPILVVTRYDREVTTEGEIRRVHQEDMAQAFGISAGAKYEEHGGPSLLAIARLLRDWSRDGDTLDRLLEVMVINMVVGNADAHAKNLSVLHFENGAVSLAPAYDIVSTAFYPNVDVRPGMYVNGKTAIHDVTTGDMLAEAVSWGLQRSRASRRIQTLLEGLPEAIGGAEGDVPMTSKALVELVRSRTDRFTATLPL